MSELLKAVDVVMRETLGRQPGEVMRTEVTVGNTIAQNVVGGHEDAVAHGDRRLLLTAAPPQARVLGAEIGASGAAGSPAAQNGTLSGEIPAERPLTGMRHQGGKR